MSVPVPPRGGHSNPRGDDTPTTISLVPPALLAEIDAARKALGAAEERAAGPHWGALHKLLLRAKSDPITLMRIVGGRDLSALDALLRMLRGEAFAGSAPAPPQRGSAGAVDAHAGSVAAGTPAATPSPDAATLRSAMRAFRKRLKLIRLDHQSRLGVGPLTGGRSHDVDAIIPPNEFPHAVWEALADAGTLTRAGQGFYALPEDATPRH
ncbi:MAG TPA: hypothetical protein PKC43_04120 [Phycisphaerales bacterium]|nr:hypothetical protein [Phycisphaerales bacterium]HMP36613.1 hypothetical protein [Phycisphaerales bacterium]